LNSETSIVFAVKIPHTDPKTPFINFISNIQISMPDDTDIPEKFKLVLLLNKSIFLKSEFAKESFRIIETCYKDYSRYLDDGRMVIKPMNFFPALREIDALIFELGSILDFFAREINILFELGIDLKEVDFGSVVRVCRKKHPNEPITKALAKFITSDFYRYFRGMRNRITHRLPFITKGKLNQIFFPDDPKSDNVDPLTKKEIDILKTCKEWLYEILSFVDQTSIIVFPKMGQIRAIDNKTGEEVDIYERFRRE